MPFGETKLSWLAHHFAPRVPPVKVFTSSVFYLHLKDELAKKKNFVQMVGPFHGSLTIYCNDFRNVLTFFLQCDTRI